MTASVPAILLNNGVAMPQLGLGVWQVPDDVAHTAVMQALDAGYRAIDTAMIYNNEVGVGKAIAASGLPREDIFITTKLWNTDQGRSTAAGACDASLERLGLDYVDLYLIHWPKPKANKFVETWEVLEHLVTSGKVRAIGVSNFEIEHLERLIDAGLTVPAVNQIELHPRLQQRELRAFHAKYDIATTAWSPLGQGTLLDDETIVDIASRVGRTPAQVIIRWHLQVGNIVIPKSVTPSRIVENISVFDFELTPEDVTRIDALDAGGRIGPHPNLADF